MENKTFMICKDCGYEMTQYQAINSYKGLCISCYNLEDE